MIKYHKTILILLLMLATLFFWWLQPTTPERIGSLIFVVMISIYSVAVHRDDVLAASITFFTVIDVNHIIFDRALPIWIAALTTILVIYLLWLLLFGRSGWFLAIASGLAVAEMTLAVQYTNLNPNLQALLTVAPAALIIQHYFFKQHRPNY